MDLARFRTITDAYPTLRIAVFGDFCLDRYLEIDPSKPEVSIETGLPVYNVVNVRAQPGGAGTIVNNLSALGIKLIYPVGFAGDDGEGMELWQALEHRTGVHMNQFVRSAQRRTFTYCKPLICGENRSPVELNRLDFKNWSPTPALLQGLLLNHLTEVSEKAEGIILLDQVDIPETGAVTQTILDGIKNLAQKDRQLPILADSRRGLRGFPPVMFKMNAVELSVLTNNDNKLDLEDIKASAAGLADKNARAVFITLSEKGMVGAAPHGKVEHVPSLPIRGEIDVVGAGDAVSANLVGATAAGATLREALEIASAAASVVIHKLGTTGTANVAEIEDTMKVAGLFTQ